MKFGYQGGYLMDDRFPYTNSQFMTFRMNNGRPDQINEIIDYNLIQQRVRYDAYYAQEQWTMGRITLQGALRFDRASSIFPAAHDRRRPLPADGHVVPGNQGRRCVQGPDAARRRGDRSLRRRQDGAEVQRRPLPRGGAERRPVHREPSDLAHLDDGVARVDRREQQLQARLRPANNAAQDLRASGGDICGAVANTNFGKSVFDTTQDPALFNGWGVRSGDWQWGASIQRQVAPRVSVEVSYLRRWLLNFVVTDNLAIAASDFDKFTVNAPADARLPNGGGYASRARCTT